MGHWTLDNASNNETFMKELETLLRLRDIDFDYTDRRIMCFPHVINICCQHVINEFTNLDLIDAPEPEELPPALVGTQSYDDAVRRDPIAHSRNIVHVLRTSGQRRDTFADLIIDGNAKGWFRAGIPPVVIKLPPLQLLCDVRTQLDTVFFMIRHLRELQPVSTNITPSNDSQPADLTYRQWTISLLSLSITSWWVTSWLRWNGRYWRISRLFLR